MIHGMRLDRQLVFAISACLCLTAYAITAALIGWPAIGGDQKDSAISLFERICVYALFGSGLSLFLPGRLLLICALLVVATFENELAQVLRPDRYPSISDATLKSVSAMMGAAVAQAVLMFLPRS